MTQIQIPTIWKKLILERVKFVTSDQIKEIAKKIGKEDIRSLRYLQEHGYIFRILRGIFYVKGPEEIQNNSFRYSLFEMVSEALKIKEVNYWYFGLETALKMNKMTHEYFTVNYVITDSFRTPKTIEILNSKFVFTKWSERTFSREWMIKQITKNDCSIYYSDKEKTILDISYRNYLDKMESKSIFAPLVEFGDQLNKEKVIRYLNFYPPKFREIIENGRVLSSSLSAV